MLLAKLMVRTKRGHQLGAFGVASCRSQPGCRRVALLGTGRWGRQELVPLSADVDTGLRTSRQLQTW